MRSGLKILFAGGGTGGHLFSGIAVADFARKRLPGTESLFVGTPFGLEKDIVPQAGYALRFIQASPLKGSGLAARVKSLLRLPSAYFQSKKILAEFQPDLVIGIGGYASGPMTLAAHFAKIPTAIIEQNSIPGFTNRKLARFVDKIFITFEKARDFFPKGKTVLSGNPARPLESVESKKEPGKFCVFILGGSQGAHALNVAVMKALPLLKAHTDQLSFIHQTGADDFIQVKAGYGGSGMSAQVFPFLQNLAPYYAQADLMLCRAGAGTITELQNLGKASILVPYPFAADDHQLYNAREMVDAGAAELLLNQELNGEILAQKISHFVENPESLRAMEARAKTLAKPNAAERVLESCLTLLKS